MSLTFSTFFCDSGLSAPPKMVHSVFFCAACGSGERKATAPFWVSSLHSPIHWMIHPHSFAREFMLIPAFVHTSSFHLVVLSYLPSVLRSVYCWFLFQQISILSVHRLIQLIHSSTQRAALATRPLFAWLVCVPPGKWMFQRVFLVGTLSLVLIKYPQSIHKVSTKYPQSIHEVSTKYPRSIHKVSTKYPSSIHQVANFYQFLVPIFLANHMWKLTSSGGCTSLRSVEIPISVTSIGGWAFQDWHWAASITTITMEG